MASDGYNHYVFQQRNSGGRYIGPDEFVVTATSSHEAWNILCSQPWYTDESCPCCGPRWVYLPYVVEDMVLTMNYEETI